jgi:predicted metalloprotease with PDZ domain
MQHPEALTLVANSLNGLPILGCAIGSPAARAGLQYGDIVLALNGTPTPSWAAFFEAAHAQRALHLRVFRQGRELELQLQLDTSPRTPRAVLDAPYREKAQPRSLAITTEQLDLS